MTGCAEITSQVVAITEVMAVLGFNSHATPCTAIVLFGHDDLEAMGET